MMWDRLTLNARETRQSEIRAVTRRIQAVGGVNLGQGTCALPPHAQVLEAAQKALRDGHNSYTLFEGVPPLKEAITEKYRSHNSLPISEQNVLVTVGATGAFECICKCFLDPGDEVVLFEPIYQYHVNQIKTRGAIPRYVRLRPPDWSFREKELEAAFTDRTKLFVFSNPNNPCGRVLTREELLIIGETCRRRNVIAVSDEVYEYILGSGAEHISLASLPGMFDHTLTISSASKTFFVTGWRIGWLVGPEQVMWPLGVKADQTFVCAPTPFQHAIADALRLDDEFFHNIRKQFQTKQAKLSMALQSVGLKPYVTEGAYYILTDYTALGFEDDARAVNALIEQARVAAVPGSEFFVENERTGLLRFCFALTDDELDRACNLLEQSPLRSLLASK